MSSSEGTQFHHHVQEPPKESYITAVEEACTRLLPKDSEELRAESSQLLRNNCLPKPNLTLQERNAIKELKEDHSWVVLTVDKGMAMVVMDKEDYTDKALSLLANSNTYNVFTKDPTTKLKNKLVPTLRDIQNQGGLSDCSYRKVDPTSAIPSKIL